jgi:lysophospholipase L1-like esterase
MKILAVGDSWTRGYGLEPTEKCWPGYLSEMLNTEVVRVAANGASNQDIYDNLIKLFNKDHYDLVIVGWSGVSRIGSNPQFSLSYVKKEDTSARLKYFKTHSLDDLINQQNKLIKKVHSLCSKNNSKVIQWSVFGDQCITKNSLCLSESAFEFLAEIQEKKKFKYEIPIFEFDFLHDNNYVMSTIFAEKYFNSTWKQACVEREEVRLRNDRTLFFNCGHPNTSGYKLWAEHLVSKIKEIV